MDDPKTYPLGMVLYDALRESLCGKCKHGCFPGVPLPPYSALPLAYQKALDTAARAVIMFVEQLAINDAIKANTVGRT